MKTLLQHYLVPVLLLMLSSAAQQGTILHIRGHLTDASTGRGVAGVSISSVQARHGATTDANGFFRLDLRDGAKPATRSGFTSRKRSTEQTT